MELIREKIYSSSYPKHSLMWRVVHFLGFHKWDFVFSTGQNKYRECEICGKRDVVCSLEGGYQPIDKDWLNGNPYKNSR